MDENVKEVGEPLSTKSGSPARHDYEYERNGVSGIFMFFEQLAGKRYVEVTNCRMAIDWSEQIRDLVDVRYPDAKRIALIRRCCINKTKSEFPLLKTKSHKIYVFLVRSIHTVNTKAAKLL